MQRRDLLAGIGCSLLAITGIPKPSLGIGGITPVIGQSAPNFSLPGTSLTEPNRDHWELEQFKGSWLIVYFYPKDFTTGCSIEARGFEAIQKQLKAAGAFVVGISADEVDDHASFCSQESLSFPLLSDPDGLVSKGYGSWMAPSSLRHTFLIDPEGIVRERWLTVRPRAHAHEVLNQLTSLQS